MLNLDNLPKSIEMTRDENGPVFKYVDQRELPAKLRIESTRDWQRVMDAIKTLAVRGAPAIGLAGASALALWAAYADTFEHLDAVARQVACVRPTAVNLQWAVERAQRKAHALIKAGAANEVARALFELAVCMQEEDEAVNRAIGANGAALLRRESSILTHCNAGSLATYYFGTALGVVYTAAQQGKITRVYADETRPVGQGARLTTWELSQAGVPVTLICDNMAASLMAQGAIDAVIVGADRIARNGDTANKIGTLGVAVLAKEFDVPFYVAAPQSTIDMALDDGTGIPIETRDAAEVLPVPLNGVDVWNPAFDVTPARYIAKIITEKGAFSPESLHLQL